MPSRTIGSWPLAWLLCQDKLPHSVAVFDCHRLHAVRAELEQYFDAACILTIRLCSRRAVPDEGFAHTLNDDIVSRIFHPDQTVQTAVFSALGKLRKKYDCFLFRLRFEPRFRVGRALGSPATPPSFALMGNVSVIRAILAVLPALDEEESDSSDPIPFAVDALDALSAVSDKGNPSVISAVVERTHHADVWVRDTAVRTLEDVANVGNQLAITAAVRCIDDAEDEEMVDDDDILPIRGTALQTLKVIAEATDNVMVVSAVAERIKHDELAGVRVEALCTLQRVAVKGNAAAISACVECLTDDDDNIKDAAWEAVEQLAVEGCKIVIEACLASLEDVREDVCHSAAVLLGRVAPEGHAATVECLAAQTVLWGSRSEELHEAILRSLSLVAPRGNRTAVSAIMHVITTNAAHGELSGSKRVPWHAVFRALQEVAAKGDVAVMSFVASYLGSKIQDVREEASYSLCMLIYGSTMDTSCAWLASVREELYDQCSNSTDREGAHVILKEVLKEQGWLPSTRLRTKSSITPLCMN